jgi:putative PIN family toxin of toxin-antitoxin system
VVDTNIFISAFLKGGEPEELIRKWEQGRVVILMSRDIVEEILEVLLRPKIGAPFSYVERLGKVIYRKAVIAKPRQQLQAVIGDPKDNKFLECAVEGKADYIISGDQHLLSLREYQGIEIVKTKEFLEKLEKEE